MGVESGEGNGYLGGESAFLQGCSSCIISVSHVLQLDRRIDEKTK